MQDAEIIQAIKEIAPEVWAEAIRATLWWGKVGVWVAIGFGASCLLSLGMFIYGLFDAYDRELLVGLGLLLAVICAMIAVASGTEAYTNLHFPQYEALKSLLPTR